MKLYLKIWESELDLTIKTARSHQGGVQCIGSVSGHKYLDVTTSIETVQLVDQLQHGSLNFIVTTSSIINTSALIINKKDNIVFEVIPPIASTSSKKIMQAFFDLAISKSSLIILAPSPTYFCTNSEPMTLMKVASVRLATALADRVLPVPGGP